MGYQEQISACTMMQNETNQPLASLCITCYNQAAYIRESIQSAFDQTYSPLEIIICDDNSTDGTDIIVEDMVNEYRHSCGRHKIVFRRNEKNLFVAKNYEQAFRLANGHIRITGAGDDISLPNRVARIVELFNRGESEGKNVSCLLHGWFCVNASGKQIGSCKPWDIKTPLGAAAAYRDDVFSSFIPMAGECHFYEDDLFSLRAFAIGDVLMVNEPLIKYRIDDGLSHAGSRRCARAKMSKAVLDACTYFSCELLAVRDKLQPERYSNVKELLDWKKRHYEVEFKVCQGRFVWQRAWAFRKMNLNSGWNRSEQLRHFLFVLPSCLESIIRVVLRIKRKIAL